MKKLISLLLSAIMLVQFLPIATLVAYAAEAADDEIAVDNGYIQIVMKMTDLPSAFTR